MAVPATAPLFLMGVIMSALGVAVALAIRPAPPQAEGRDAPAVPLGELLRRPGMSAVLIASVVTVTAGDLLVIYLPLLGAEGKELFNQFRLDQPWDSAHNKKLIEKMPDVFAAPGKKSKEPGLTYYQVFTGPLTIFTGPKGTRITQITDGTSGTLLLAEGGEAVPWTKPQDMEYDAKKPLPKLGGHSKGGFSVVFFDGSVRFITSDVKAETLKALITRNGGEVIDGF